MKAPSASEDDLTTTKTKKKLTWVDASASGRRLTEVMEFEVNSIARSTKGYKDFREQQKKESLREGKERKNQVVMSFSSFSSFSRPLLSPKLKSYSSRADSVGGSLYCRVGPASPLAPHDLGRSIHR
jgi:hypothetical protein